MFALSDDLRELHQCAFSECADESGLMPTECRTHRMEVSVRIVFAEDPHEYLPRVYQVYNGWLCAESGCGICFLGTFPIMAPEVFVLYRSAQHKTLFNQFRVVASNRLDGDWWHHHVELVRARPIVNRYEFD